MMSRMGNDDWVQHIDFGFLDFIGIFSAYFISIYIQFGEIPTGTIYLDKAIVLLVIQLSLIVLFNYYRNIVFRGLWLEFKEEINHSSVVWLLFVLVLYVSNNLYWFNSSMLVSAWLIQIICNVPLHCIRKRLIRNKIRKKDDKSLILVTESDIVEELVNLYRHNKQLGLKIKGIVLLDKEECNYNIFGIPIVATRDSIKEYLCRNWVDEVLLQCRHNQEEAVQIAEICKSIGITVHLGITALNEIDRTKWFIQSMYGFSVITYRMKTISYTQAFVKRCIDIVGGLIGTIVTGVLYVFLAPIIYIKSPGPIIFKQVRIGKNGRKFHVYKFRSMYLDAEERKQELIKQNVYNNNLLFKMENDPRIIKGVGAFIRQHNIDEFPQFVNVLLGSMSIVGTRPPTINEWENYRLSHRARMSIKPGITGNWQIEGKFRTIDFDEVVKMDVEYIRNYSLLSDVKIIARTVKAMFSGNTLEKENRSESEEKDVTLQQYHR